MDKNVEPVVGTTSLKNKHRIVWVGTQTIRQGATGGTATHNHIIKRFYHALILP
jgi:hypothetical protein